MIVRHASKEDCAAIGEIYNHAVLHTAAIWNDKTVDADNRIAWFEARQFGNFPVLVSEENGIVTGYASYGDWRAFDGYRAGATQQEIAQIILNTGRLDRDEWQASSARHAIKALLRDARSMVAGGYRKLLRHRRPR